VSKPLFAESTANHEQTGKCALSSTFGVQRLDFLQSMQNASLQLHIWHTTSKGKTGCSYRLSILTAFPQVRVEYVSIACKGSLMRMYRRASCPESWLHMDQWLPQHRWLRRSAVGRVGSRSGPHRAAKGWLCCV